LAKKAKFQSKSRKLLKCTPTNEKYNKSSFRGIGFAKYAAQFSLKVLSIKEAGVRVEQSQLSHQGEAGFIHSAQ
jgi:hypothetical protein